MAANARPYVVAASAAGFQVLAADVFGDEDTLLASDRHLLLDYDSRGFSADAVRDCLLPAIEEFGASRLLYGSGFEAQPALIAELASQVDLVGNSAETVAACKDARRFFQACVQHRIPVPETCFAQPLAQSLPAAEAAQWLSKRQGGCGGMHIVPAGLSTAGEENYFQRKVDGQPFSLLFLAYEGGIQPLGFQRQLLSPLDSLPYRYGGLAGPAVMAGAVTKELIRAAGCLADAFGLRGLNSLDVVVDGEQFWVLEANPRLSSSLGLYPMEMQAEWLVCHISGQPASFTLSGRIQATANLVFYAPFDIRIPGGFSWPEWTMDKPLAGSTIARNMPLCSIEAEADNAQDAEALARTRMTLLSAMLQPYSNP
ncbi:ATP-grasp domain-containing protein [Methylobacillus pratensis]